MLIATVALISLLPPILLGSVATQNLKHEEAFNISLLFLHFNSKFNS